MHVGEELTLRILRKGQELDVKYGLTLKVGLCTCAMCAWTVCATQIRKVLERRQVTVEVWLYVGGMHLHTASMPQQPAARVRRCFSVGWGSQSTCLGALKLCWQAIATHDTCSQP